MILPKQRSNISIGFVSATPTVVYGASKGETIVIGAGAIDSLLANSMFLCGVVATYLLF
jgi:hypothetical protein